MQEPSNTMQALTEEELTKMKASCSLTAEALLLVGDVIEEGMTTLELDSIVAHFIHDNGAYPSPLHYHGFPRCICTSRNQVMCHGIPHSKEKLKNGDIINVDISVFRDGFHGDTSAMFYIGEVSEEARKLVEVARECLQLGIEAVKPGAHIGDIGHAIQKHASQNGFSSVRDFVGHGVGRVFHGEPQIPHVGLPNTGSELVPGMIFTIEPIINEGVAGYEILKEDDWTVLTIDRKLSAQFEHTLLVTEKGCNILTARDRVLVKSETEK